MNNDRCIRTNALILLVNFSNFSQYSYSLDIHATGVSYEYDRCRHTNVPILLLRFSLFSQYIHTTLTYMLLVFHLNVIDVNMQMRQNCN